MGIRQLVLMLGKKAAGLAQHKTIKPQASFLFGVLRCYPLQSPEEVFHWAFLPTDISQTIYLCWLQITVECHLEGFSWQQLEFNLAQCQILYSGASLTLCSKKLTF